MTREEAAELILYNKPWRMCEVCDQRGTAVAPHDRLEVGDPVAFNREGLAVPIKRCAACRGTGVVVRGDYLEAYQLLEMPTPDTTQLYRSHRMHDEAIGLVLSVNGKEATIRLNASNEGGGSLSRGSVVVRR